MKKIVIKLMEQIKKIRHACTIFRLCCLCTFQALLFVYISGIVVCVHFRLCCLCTFQALLTASKDLLADVLDKQYGSEVTDKSIFSKLSSHFEEDFHLDMANLNVSCGTVFNAFLCVSIFYKFCRQFFFSPSNATTVNFYKTR